MAITGTEKGIVCIAIVNELREAVNRMAVTTDESEPSSSPFSMLLARCCCLTKGETPPETPAVCLGEITQSR
ncbi:hypothetical protein EYF80_013754 [Liparis tanakae]|uniref:Uncharacterized protein n=1 Tax=Liparis tanakae TaxID=230148 RepID=A0A4Z2IE09_9TELE|nr:hypothetical protein EYF80_013754 [Liparis tanakae]